MSKVVKIIRSFGLDRGRFLGMDSIRLSNSGPKTDVALRAYHIQPNQCITLNEECYAARP